MAIVIPVKLSNAAANVLQVVCLYPPVPAYQPDLSPSQFQRDTSAVSFGFPFSIDTPYDNIDLTSPTASATGSDIPGVYPIPPNAYALLLPSQIYNNNTVLDTAYNILLLDVTVCPIQPGFSRLRVDYIDANNNKFTDYLDMPFWEMWDNHPSLIQEIVDYSEESTTFIQGEINYISQDLYNSLSRAQLRGMSVSGTVYSSQALNRASAVLPTNQGFTAHQKYLQGKFEQYHAIKAEEKKQFELAKSLTYPVNITSVTPDNGLFPGDIVVFTTDATLAPTDQVYLATHPLSSITGTSSISAVIPSTVAFNLNINSAIIGINGQKTENYPLSIIGFPSLSYINGVSTGFVSPNGSFALYGSNFGLTQGATTISFNNGTTDGSLATITSWTTSVITGVVPSDALNGQLLLTTDKGQTASLNIIVLGDKELDVFAISPTVASVAPGETIQFNASVNASNVEANWSIVTDFGNIGAGDVAHGFINTKTGLYTAPNIVQSPFNLKIVANYSRYYGNLYAETSLVVLAAANTYTISPSSAILEPSFTQSFALFHEGAPVTGVTWYVNGIAGGNINYGTINNDGLYQAPASIPNSGTVNVTGISTGGFGTAVVSIVSVGSINNANNSGNQSHDMMMAKTLTGPSCCLGPISEVFSATVGTPLVIPSFESPNGQQVDGNTTYYVSAFLQSGCGNQDGQLYVGTGGNLNNYGYISYTPASVGTGFASIRVYSVQSTLVDGNTVTTGGLSTVVVNINPAPTPILSSINSGCPGQNVIVTGQYFPPDAQVVFTPGSQLLPTVVPPSTADGVNYSMTVTIPSNVSITANSYSVQINSSFTASSKTATLVVPSSCSMPSISGTVQITPARATVYTSATLQFQAQVSFSDGTFQDVTSQTQWYVENIAGGNNYYGNISSSGLYTAPSSVPYAGSNPPTVSGVYVYNNEPIQVNVYPTIIAPSTPNPPVTSQPPASESGSCYLLTVTPNTATVVVPGEPIQFQANFIINEGDPTTVFATQWFVAGIPGGNSTYGTIDDTGLYTPPAYYIPSDAIENTVGASYTYTPTGGEAYTFAGYSVITYDQVSLQSGDCTVTTVGEINLNFGDGRCGYLPAGTSIDVPAGSYLYLVFQDALDENFNPINTGVIQNLTYGTISAQSTDLLSVLYNQGSIVADNSNDGGVYSAPISIPLGLVDPTTGVFQSMWDTIPVLAPVNNTIETQSLSCSVEHDLGDAKSFSIVQHIDNKLASASPIDTSRVLENNNVIWVGKVRYSSSTLFIDKAIQFLSMVDGKFTVNKVDSDPTMTMTSGQALMAVFKNNQWKLEVVSFGDTLPEGSRTYVLGIITDKFYSLWPLLNAKNNVVSNFQSDVNYMEFGDLVFQWGPLPKNGYVKFSVPFKDSCSIKTTASDVNHTLEGFKFTIIDREQPGNWFAFGS
jgi:hypothetical protein